MLLSELIPFLKQRGASLKKSLSQNFLIDPNIARKMAILADVQAEDVILEIGPGAGALTDILLERGATVYAIEKDPLFAQALERLQTADQRLKVFCADALTFPFSELPSPLKVVSNLPYHITTPLLERCFKHRFSSLTLMVQKELGDRLLAKPGTKEFGSLALFAQFHAQVKGSFSVSASCFYPKPRVDSFAVRLDAAAPPLHSPLFFPLMRHAFQQRRKQLSSSLKGEFAPAAIKHGLTQCGLREDARPESLSLKEWLQFTLEMEKLSKDKEPGSSHFFFGQKIPSLQE